ncbi:hypothetical protein GCM10023336_73400 [Streptomyces similanensis]|uniref:Uncharacterized protein n=1 Tax=Streptomyces similanensis TaxID=1274988 RepID=A0ABP9LP89_9ACTN
MVSGPTCASTSLVTAYELLHNSAAATTEQIARTPVLRSSTLLPLPVRTHDAVRFARQGGEHRTASVPES